VDKLRLGVVGCGGFARHHLKKAIEGGPWSVAALCDPSAGSLERCFSEIPELGGTPTFGDHEAMLAVGGLDAVLVCSPHTLHASQVEAAFAAGCHVLVEKPLATTVADCRRLIRARDASGKVGAVSYQRHGAGPFQFVRRVVQSGALGAPRMLNSHLAQQWLRFTEGTWRQDPGLSGGGQINDSGSHMVDVILWATGLRARRVSAMMDNRGTKVDIDSVVGIEFEGGAYGSLTIIGDAVLWHERHAFWLERGAVFIEEDKVTTVDAEGAPTIHTEWPAPVHPLEDFAEAVRSGSAVLAPFECGLRTMELTEAAWASAARQGEPVEVASD
jgi:predicted dehydrogenase